MSLGHHLKKKLINKSNKFIFFYPGNIKQKTGGYIYENNIFEYSKKNKNSIHFNELSDNYPFPSNKDLKYLNSFIANLNSDKILIFDGLVLEGLAKEEYIFNNFKTIALIHHPLYLEFRGKKSDNFLDIAKKIYKKVDYFIVTSSDTKRLLSKKFNINSNIISIVEPGIEKLKKYKKPSSKIVKLLTCGSIIERKKYDYLINEIQELNNFELHIIGDTTRETKYSAKIKKQINDNKLTKKIVLHGKVSQIKLEKLYSQCDFYISTSKYEGFGMSLANAAISKLPIISYETSTIKKTIGKSGVLYFNNFKKGTLQKLILNNCFNKEIYKKLKKSMTKKKYLTNNQSAKLFIKAISNA